MRNDKGRSLIELVFSITVTLILYAMFARHWIVNLGEAREVALENTLTNLKYSLELYSIIEGQYPKDLKELNKTFTAAREDSLYGRKYLELQSQDEEGYPVDPYGRKLIYDEKTGKIKIGGQNEDKE